MAKKDEDKKDPTLLKIQDMIEYAFPQIDKFPRPEKSYEGMATRLKGIMARMAENCMDTKKCYYAKSLLKQMDELDREIMHCKFWVKVAYQPNRFPPLVFWEWTTAFADLWGQLEQWRQCWRVQREFEQPSLELEQQHRLPLRSTLICRISRISKDVLPVRGDKGVHFRSGPYGRRKIGIVRGWAVPPFEETNKS